MVAATKSPDKRRPERVASRIREELAAALTRDLSDPRLTGVVIADVRVTDDLSTARVAIVVAGDDPSAGRATAAARVLTRLEGGLRKRMAPGLNMRRVPTLRFEVAAGRAETDRLDALLHEVAGELRHRSDDDDTR